LSDLEVAIRVLREGGYSLVVVKNGRVAFTGRERGIIDALECVKRRKELAGSAAADKVLGKAAALLLAYAGVKEFYGEITSLKALEALRRLELKVEIGRIVREIIGREGRCPFEEALEEVWDPREAYRRVKEVFLSISKQ